jgi:hypothetical protein
MDLINEIVKIIVAHKVIITWIVIGWLLVVFFIIKPIHQRPFWGQWIRGIGEVTLGGLWMILCVGVLYLIPGLAIMLVIAFSFFHYTRWLDDKRKGPTASRTTVGFFVMLILVAAMWLSWVIGGDPIFQVQRGIAQLTSNTVFANAGKSCKHWLPCTCSFSIRGTGIRPSEPKQATAGADTSSWTFRIFGGSDSTKTSKQAPGRSK